MILRFKFILGFVLLYSTIGFAQKPQPIDPELQKLKANLATAKHDTARILAYIEMGVYFRDLTDYADSALLCGLKAGQLAEQYPHYSQTPRVWNTIGLSYKNLYQLSDNETLKKKHFELAEKYFKKCMYEAKKVGNLNQMAAAWFYLSDLYRHLPNKYDYFKTSFELVNCLQKKTSWNNLDSMILRKTYKSLCITLDYETGSKKRNEYLQNSKQFTNKEGEDYEHLFLLQFEQYALLWKKKDEKRLLEEYHQYKKAIKTNYLNDELDHVLAQYYFSIQEYEKSFQLMDNFSLKNYSWHIKQRANGAYLGMKYMIMGQNAYMLNRNQEATRYLNKAIHYFNPFENIIGLENEKYTALLYLGKAYKKAGKYKQALAYTEQAEGLYKQMHDVGIQALLAENDVQVEQIQQDKKLQEAQTQTLLKEHEVKIEKRQKYVYMGLLGLALLLASWAIYNFIRKNKLSEQLEIKKNDLENSNLLKDKLFALLSHDLRSPINRVIKNLNNSPSVPQQEVRKELKGVQDILNNILYWANTQLKGIQPVYTALPLRSTIESIIKEYQLEISDKKITLINAIDKNIVLDTDENLLKIILRNIISNAIKFTPDEGFIHLNCSKSEDRYELVVKDTGIGIAQDKLEKVFLLPTPTQGTNQEKGTGLGLGLSLDIARKLKGDITIKSQENKGSTVYVSLPA